MTTAATPLAHVRLMQRLDSLLQFHAVDGLRDELESLAEAAEDEAWRDGIEYVRGGPRDPAEGADSDDALVGSVRHEIIAGSRAETAVDERSIRADERRRVLELLRPSFGAADMAAIESRIAAAGDEQSTETAASE